MDDERIEEIAEKHALETIYGDIYWTTVGVSSAIKQALAEERERIADWIQKQKIWDGLGYNEKETREFLVEQIRQMK